MSNKYQVFNLDTGVMREALGNEPLDLVSPNLSVEEFACNDGNPIVPYSPKIAAVFQKIRDKYGALTVNSGFRTILYNKKVGGFSTSQHKDGEAIDIKTPKGIDDEVFLIEIMGLIGEEHGFGLYDGRVHIDVRGYYDFWDSRK